MKSRTIFILRTIGDFLILLLVIILCGELHKKLPVRNPAIWCNDESIKYPYKVDTISNLTLIVTTILVPFLVIIISQIILRPRPRLGSSWNRTFFHSLYQSSFLFIFGFWINTIIMELSKRTVGRLRPHFLAVCEPNLNCSNGTYFHTNYICGNPNEKLIREAQMSFFSGHATMAMYGAVTLIMYLHYKLSGRKLFYLRTILQLILLMYALYVGFSRVADYKHHWTDVVVGFAFGGLVAVLMYQQLPRGKLNGSDSCDLPNNPDRIELRTIAHPSSISVQAQSISRVVP